MSDAFRLPRRALLGAAAATPFLGRAALADESVVVAHLGRGLCQAC